MNFLPGLNSRCSNYNEIIPSLVDRSSLAYSKETELVICHVDGLEVLKNGAFDGCSAHAAEYLDSLQCFVERNSNKVVMSSTLCRPPLSSRSYSDLIAENSSVVLELECNARLRDMAKSHANFCLLDIDILYRQFGAANLHNSSYWYAGRIKYSNLMFRTLGLHYIQLLKAYRWQCKKVLVLDLDNTLWGGVLGEDGIAGIELSEDGVGKCYRDFQSAVKELKEQGVLLALSSKNELDEVVRAFSSHPMMVLSLDDFVVKKVGWGCKADSIVEIAQELGLGLDSVVFLDDNPVERDLVRQHLPKVVVPDFVNKIEQYSEWFVENIVYKHFPKYRVTPEDAFKSTQYSAKMKREETRRSLDFEVFLENLHIRLEFHVDDLDHVERAAQLTQKTNQYNTTTKRFTSAEIVKFVNSPRYRVILLRYSDKFGPEGIVGFALLDLSDACIVSLLLSCRVIGRRVENSLLNFAEHVFCNSGKREITGIFVPTAKNHLAATLYEANGYALIRESDDGEKVYAKKIESS